MHLRCNKITSIVVRVLWLRLKTKQLWYEMCTVIAVIDGSGGSPDSRCWTVSVATGASLPCSWLAQQDCSPRASPAAPGPWPGRNKHIARIEVLADRSAVCFYDCVASSRSTPAGRTLGSCSCRLPCLQSLAASPFPSPPLRCRCPSACFCSEPSLLALPYVLIGLYGFILSLLCPRHQNVELSEYGPCTQRNPEKGR